MATRLVKVRFCLDVTDWHGHGSETFWAEPLETLNPSLFQIMNSPFFTRGIAYRDTVIVRRSEDDMLQYKDIHQRGGHSSFMILLQEHQPLFERYWGPLQKLGCSYESMTINLSVGKRQLLSVDVPEHAELKKVESVLDEGESRSAWMYQVGYIHS